MEKPRWPYRLELLSWGAESNLYMTTYMGERVVLKHRFVKKYMDPLLARKLVYSRTLREASLLVEARAAGVRVPLPLYMDADNGLLVISFIEGELVRERLEKSTLEEVRGLSCKLGSMVRTLHNQDIVHGDLTTSNFILSKEDGEPVLIDFGLAVKSKRPEDKATDIRVFERAVVSTHPSIKDEVMASFLECYQEGLEDSRLIMERYRKLSLMGRYVKERRKGRGV